MPTIQVDVFCGYSLIMIIIELLLRLHCIALFHKGSRWLEESFSALYFDFIGEKCGVPLFNAGHWYSDLQHASVSFWD